MVRVLITEPIKEVGVNILKEIAEVKFASSISEDVLVEEAKDVDAILVKMAPITSKIIENAPKLKVIANHGIGYENIDVDFATKKGIWVTNVPGASAHSVAEFTVGLMLSICRKIALANMYLHNGGWDREKCFGIDLREKTIGIVGLGTIGLKVAQKLAGFEVKLLGYDPFVNQEAVKSLGVEMVDLRDLLARSDIVTLHVPLLPGTRGLIGAKEIALMKPTAYLINVARGGVVVEKDLLEALQDKRIAGAALDVFEEEPLPADHPLRKLDNVVLTPHIAALTNETQVVVAETAARNIVNVLLGKPPLNPVNRISQSLKK